MNSKLLSFATAAAVGLGAVGPAEHAQADGHYPNKVIQAIVPFGAGGGTDRWVRVMASAGFDVFEHGMRVQNRGGASGTVGWKAMLKRAPMATRW